MECKSCSGGRPASHRRDWPGDWGRRACEKKLQKERVSRGQVHIDCFALGTRPQVADAGGSDRAACAPGETTRGSEGEGLQPRQLRSG